MKRRGLQTYSLVSALLVASSASAAWQPDDSQLRQALDEAWWTGPILAGSADSTAVGHFLVEPYLYDSSLVGHFDQRGRHQKAARFDTTRLAPSILYGVADRLTIGATPVFGLNRDGSNGHLSLGLGDLSVQAQYRLTDFQPGRGIPTVSVLLGATFPTGRCDELGAHGEDGMGTGAYVGTAAVFSQYYFWLPSGRILRTRLDLSYSVSDHPSLRDVSVYGTPPGFRGRAAPGAAFAAYLSGEYSLTRSWVLALEVGYQHADSTHVSGHGLATPGQLQTQAGHLRIYEASSGSSRAVALAPEIEYNWNSRVGLLAGVVSTVAGRNAAETLTSVVAINYNL